MQSSLQLSMWSNIVHTQRFCMWTITLIGAVLIHWSNNSISIACNTDIMFMGNAGCMSTTDRHKTLEIVSRKILTKRITSRQQKRRRRPAGWCAPRLCQSEQILLHMRQLESACVCVASISLCAMYVCVCLCVIYSRLHFVNVLAHWWDGVGVVNGCVAHILTHIHAIQKRHTHTPRDQTKTHTYTHIHYRKPLLHAHWCRCTTL